MLDRRRLLQSMGAGVLAANLPGISFAAAPTRKKFVLVVLRGAVDGLALAAPYGDGKYRSQRGELALDGPGTAGGLVKLDGLFGLHPRLANIHESFAAGEASIVHAVASPYRERSHFDGQDLLETGGSRVGGAHDGWLNRALAAVGENPGDATAIALAPNTPLVLRGSTSVSSWAPSKLPDADEATIRRLERLYADDEFFATRLQQALRSQEIAGDELAMSGSRGGSAKQFADLMTAAARFLTEDNGPTIATVELGGWDTHARQGTTQGALANQFTALDNGIGNLRTGLGKDWQDTVVLVVTEFGRTVHPNGTSGTDHGTGTAAIVIGGAVRGGNVITDWPGLRDQDLYEGRDLMATKDLRSVFKAVLSEHLNVPAEPLENTVFPGSESAIALENLIQV